MMSPLRRQFFRVLSLISLLVLVFFFQNCSQVHFLTEDPAGYLKNENNGGGYTGKPDGDFYRFVPGFTCEDKESFQSHIHVSGGDVSLSENKRTMCAKSGLPLDPALLDLSIYQNEILGYLEGIFESESAAPTRIPANLVEVWCRDSKDSSGIETITHYDRDSQLAVTRIYYTGKDSVTGVSGPLLIPDFQVSRVVKNQLITIRDGSGFELLVHRDQIASEPGLFQGHMKAVIDGTSVNRDTSCRVGGSLDTTVWPARQIVDVDVLNFKISSDQNFMGYVPSSPSPLTVPLQLFLIEPLKQKYSLLTSNLSGSAPLFDFTSDSKRIVYGVNDSNAAKVDLVSTLTSDVSKSFVLSPALTGVSTFQLSSDSNTVVYNSGDTLHPWVQSIAVDGSSVAIALTAFNADPAMIPTSPQTDVSGRFHISSVGHKAVFVCCNSKIDLYSSNINGSDLRLITPSLPTGYVVENAIFLSPNSDQIIKVSAWSDTTLNGPITSLEFIMRVDGTNVYPLAADWMVSYISPDANLVILRNSRSEQKLVNLTNRTEIVLPSFPSLPGSNTFFFTSDSLNYILTTVDANGFTRIKSMSTSTGALTDICEALPSASTAQEIRPGVLALVAKNDAANQLRVYVSSLSGPCKLVNSLPINPATTTFMRMQVSDDGQKILIQHQNDLYYVPLDGKPAYQINAPAHMSALIQNFYFLADSHTVIFYGDQIRQGEKQIFTWTAP